MTTMSSELHQTKLSCLPGVFAHRCRTPRYLHAFGSLLFMPVGPLIPGIRTSHGLACPSPSYGRPDLQPCGARSAPRKVTEIVQKWCHEKSRMRFCRKSCISRASPTEVTESHGKSRKVMGSNRAGHLACKEILVMSADKWVLVMSADGCAYLPSSGVHLKSNLCKYQTFQ